MPLSYPDAITYLEALAKFGWKLDLARIRRLCELAGHPERAFPSVLVGGSAGKGSTCAFLDSILRAAGLKVGSAPKPHLLTYRERAQVNGELISEPQFAGLIERIVPLAEQVSGESSPPTLFEVVTLLAFLHFAESRVDRAVVEVGLGGRFDATNVLDPDLSIITLIGLDHTDRLGDTVEQIAFEKAGIIRPRGRVVTGAAGRALGVIEEVALDREACVRRLGEEFTIGNVRMDREGVCFDFLGSVSLRDLNIRLVGEHQARNAALAVASALWLAEDGLAPVGEAAIRAGLRQARMPGRLEVVRQRPTVIVDAAHSPDRAEALAKAMRALYPVRGAKAVTSHRTPKVWLVLGCSRGHDPDAVVRTLASLADTVLATKSEHPAAIPAAQVAVVARGEGVSAQEVEPVSAAVAEALRRAAPDDLILVTGSVFIVAEALAALGT